MVTFYILSKSFFLKRKGLSDAIKQCAEFSLIFFGVAKNDCTIKIRQMFQLLLD